MRRLMASLVAAAIALGFPAGALRPRRSFASSRPSRT